MGSWSISKEFHFSASHQLEGLPKEHQCARLHGHNYILKVELASQWLREPGFVLDYGELTFVKDAVDRLDHRHLNDIFDFNPTSENIVQFYWQQFRTLLNDMGMSSVTIAVGLSETPKTDCWYRGR